MCGCVFCFLLFVSYLGRKELTDMCSVVNGVGLVVMCVGVVEDLYIDQVPTPLNKFLFFSYDL